MGGNESRSTVVVMEFAVGFVIGFLLAIVVAIWLVVWISVTALLSEKHLRTCGTEYRGCDPVCPKRLAEEKLEEAGK